jgi:hypothetical protein
MTVLQKIFLGKSVTASLRSEHQLCMNIRKSPKAGASQVAPYANFIHSIVHTKVLVSCDLQPQIRDVLQEAVKCWKLVKCRPLNSRLYGVSCTYKKMHAEYRSPLLHSEVRWLSKHKL